MNFRYESSPDSRSGVYPLVVDDSHRQRDTTTDDDDNDALLDAAAKMLLMPSAAEQEDSGRLVMDEIVERKTSDNGLLFRSCHEPEIVQRSKPGIGGHHHHRGGKNNKESLSDDAITTTPEGSFETTNYFDPFSPLPLQMSSNMVIASTASATNVDNPWQQYAGISNETLKTVPGHSNLRSDGGTRSTEIARTPSFDVPSSSEEEESPKKTCLRARGRRKKKRTRRVSFDPAPPDVQTTTKKDDHDNTADDDDVDDDTLWYTAAELMYSKRRAKRMCRNERTVGDGQLLGSILNDTYLTTSTTTTTSTTAVAAAGASAPSSSAAASSANVVTDDDSTGSLPPSSGELREAARALRSCTGFSDRRGLERWSTHSHALTRALAVCNAKTEFFLEQSQQILDKYRDPNKLARLCHEASQPAVRFAHVLGLADAMEEQIY